MIMICVGGILALVLTMLFGIPYIDLMKKITHGQYIREVAPETHVQKAGTPTTGGVFIIAAIVISALITLLLAQKLGANSWIILITTLLFAILGYKDDSLKFKGKHNQGLSAKAKLLFQVIISLIPAIYITHAGGTAIQFGSFFFDLKLFYPIFAICVIVSSSNAFNLTDGLDGLAASCGIPVFLGIGFLNSSVCHFLLGNDIRRQQYRASP